MTAAPPAGTSVVAVGPSRATVLTYDDGPTPGVTDRLLPVLAAAGATATFFVLLTRVRRSPELLQEMVAAGHEVGLHGPDHLRLTSLAPSVLPERFRDAKAELEDLAGVRVRWSRPPYGAQDRGSWYAARAADLTPVLWSAHCLDWETHSLDDHLAGLRASDPASAIVLLHDGFADARDGVDDGPPPDLDRVALTRAVLDELGPSGLTGSSLGRALVESPPVTRPWLVELGDPS